MPEQLYTPDGGNTWLTATQMQARGFQAPSPAPTQSVQAPPASSDMVQLRGPTGEMTSAPRSQLGFMQSRGFTAATIPNQPTNQEPIRPVQQEQNQNIRTFADGSQLNTATGQIVRAATMQNESPEATMNRIRREQNAVQLPSGQWISTQVQTSQGVPLAEANRPSSQLQESFNQLPQTQVSDVGLPSALQTLRQTLEPTQEERNAQNSLNALIAQQANLAASRDLGVADIRNQPIAMPFVTGQRTAVENRAAAQMGALEAQGVPLKTQLATLQARRAAAFDVAKIELEAANRTEDLALKRQEIERSANKPMEVGGSLVNPSTGRVIYTAPAETKAGIVGEYQFYANQERLAGKTPLSFDDYQTRDANRKVAASQLAGANNLTPAQTSIFMRITDRFQTDAVLRQADKGFQAISIADQVLANPQNATNQLKALYILIKNLDADSAVREGELDLAQRTQSYYQRFQNVLDRVNNGVVISPDTAIQLANASKDLAQIWYQAAQRKQQQYVSQANIAGVGTAFNQYLGGTQPFYQSPPTATQAVPITEADRIAQEEQRRGMSLTPQERQRFLQQNQGDALDRALGFNQVGSDTKQAPSGMRTDRHNNPTAFTTDIARIAGLQEGTDYVAGDSFGGGRYKTARLLGDPISTTIRVIDRIGFQTGSGQPRWTYINMPKNQWDALNYAEKRNVIGQMYRHEGGTNLRRYFS